MVTFATAIAQTPGPGNTLLGGSTGSQCGVNMSCGPGGGSSTPGGGTSTGGLGGGGQCTSIHSGSNNNCNSAGPASLSAPSSAPSLMAGNPIHLASGNKYRLEEDLPPLPGPLGLELKRHYNSRLGYQGIFGVGWRMSYETIAFRSEQSVQIVQADGRRIIFARDAKQPKLCATARPADGHVIDTAKGMEWHWADGRVLDFDTHGRLEQIRDATGPFTSLAYDPAGNLLRVTDPQGRFLSFTYQRDSSGRRLLIQTMTTPVGIWHYGYDAQNNLIEVSQPVDPAIENGAKVARLYHYEADKNGGDVHNLTGISLRVTLTEGTARSERLFTFRYDKQDRAIESERAGGVEKISLIYHDPVAGRGKRLEGETELTNSLGQKSRYRWAEVGGDYVLLKATGPGCAKCSEPDVEYRYDDHANLIALVRKNETVRYSYDAKSRLVGVERQRRERGKSAGPSQWLARYEYRGDSSEPSLVARPSVVTGKEYRIEFRYNDAGQPVSITESGFAPAIPGGDRKPGVRVRTVTYRYQTVNGRSLLAEIDGPLLNGPKNDSTDSDVTRYVWDARGNYPEIIVHPGNFRSAYRYDDAGRPVELSENDGLRTVVTTAAYSGALERQSLSREAWLLHDGQIDPASRVWQLVMQASYDGLGRRTESLDGAGRIIRYAYDAAGRLNVVGDASGHEGKLEFDSENRLSRAGLYRPERPDQPARAAYFWHDEFGRVTNRLLPDGRFDTWTYDGDGRVAEHIDSDDIRTRYLRGARAQARLDQTPDGWLRLSTSSAGNSAATTTSLVDDFGQVLMQDLPDHGVKMAHYDDAGRIASIRNADGSRIDYAYDVAGRMIVKTMHDATGKLTETVHVAYEGRTVSAIVDSAQSTRYTHDALGRKIQESVQLSGLAQSLPVATRFDSDSGLVVARTLADGRVMRMSRGSPQSGALVQTLRLQPAWAAAIQDWLNEHVSSVVGETLGDWLPGDDIARDIAADPFDGLTRYIAGNGVATNKSFDIAGRLTQLNISGIDSLRYRYGTGPRIGAIESGKGTAISFRYHGFGQLDVAPDESAKLIKTAFNETSRRRNALGQTMEDEHYRYTYVPTGQVASVTERWSGKLIARYRYNSNGQRVAKTVLREDVETTTYFLWQQNHLVAEVDAQGRLTSQYLYLNDLPIAKLEGERAEGNGTGNDRILFIHADHRGAPIAMTDAAQRVVWRADLSPRGITRPVGTAASSFGSATLNLRLPGQYFDAETGLHDNWYRTYDPATGRYLQPDPLGYPDGADAYLYVNGDPVNRVDVSGLYAEDVHYYMTYFLALTAGLSATDAWIIATADQTVDNVNPFTDAFPSLGAGFAYDARKTYHFTQKGFDPAPMAGEATTTVDPNTMQPTTTYSPAYQLRRLQAWNNPQVQTLHGYAMGAPPCLKQQFYGEYLHAVEDTFGHRDVNNNPYGAVAGHLIDGTNPDMTYNHGSWQLNEQRTLEMEKVVFAQLQSDWGTTAKDASGNAITFAGLQTFLETWNAEQSSTAKIAMLEAELSSSKLFGVPTKIPAYAGTVGLGCRLKYLRDAQLIDAAGQATSAGLAQYPGAILTTATKGAAVSCTPP